MYHRWMSTSAYRFPSRPLGVVQALMLAALALGACSDDPLTQSQARDRAANELCDLEARCSQIGPPPAMYASRDACLTTWKNTVQNVWPPADCGTIVRAEFDSCIISIQNTACASGVDWLSILTKCAKVNVCGTP